MTRSAGARLASASCLLLALLMTTSTARAETYAEQTEPRAQAEHEEQDSLVVNADVVFGFGKYPLFLPTRSTNASGFAAFSDTTVTSQSFLLGAKYAGSELAIGVRAPLSLGNVPTDDGSTRSAFALGNVELEVEREEVLDDTTALILSLGISLPTAQGREEPGLEDPSGRVSLYDRFMVNRIAASSRGFEDNALFEIARIGAIPKLALRYHDDGVMVTPFIKVENLFATTLHPERRFLAEIVFGSAIAYELSEHFEIGARVWLTASVADAVNAVAVVEPQLQAHFAAMDVVLGGIVPFAGALTNPQFAALRLSVGARL